MTPAAELAAVLLDARQTGRPATAAVAVSEAQALDVQGMVARALNASVVGWKVGFGPQGQSVGGPILHSDLVASGGTFAANGYGGLIEAEIAFHLAADLPPRPTRPYTRAEVLAAVAGVHAGIERVQSRYAAYPDVPFAAQLADNLTHGGYAVAAAREEFATHDLTSLRCVLTIDGSVVSDRLGGHPQGDPLAPLLAYANTPQSGAGFLQRGHIVTTGSLTKPLPQTRGSRITLSIAGLSEVVVHIA